MNTELAVMRKDDKQVLVPPETHRQLKILAAQQGTTVRELVLDAIRSRFGLDEEAKSA